MPARHKSCREIVWHNTKGLQPVTQQKLLLRLAIGLFAIAALFLGYQWFARIAQDPDFGTTDTSEMLVAVEEIEGGSRIVLFKPDGEAVESPNYPEGAAEYSPVWRPDGQRVMFLADRDGPFSVYRWNVARNRVERVSAGSRSVSFIGYPPVTSPFVSNDSALVTSGGQVFEFNQTTGGLTQLLPPTQVRGETEEGGAVGQMEIIYGAIGNSFIDAYWAAEQSALYTVMSRDLGQVFVINPRIVGAEQTPPRPLAAGTEIHVDSTAHGAVVISIRDFQYPDVSNLPPELIEDGRPVYQYKHALAYVNWRGVAEEPEVFTIVISEGDDVVFGKPAVSPDGTMVAAPVGVQEAGVFIPQMMAIFPNRFGGGSEAVVILNGDISDISWHPSGNSLAYIKSGMDGAKAVHTIQRTGANETRVSPPGRNFSQPRFSPN